MSQPSNATVLKILRAIAAGRHTTERVRFDGRKDRLTRMYSRDEMISLARVGCREAGITEWKPDEKVTR